jgi:hypothetical protein
MPPKVVFDSLVSGVDSSVDHCDLDRAVSSTPPLIQEWFDLFYE